MHPGREFQAAEPLSPLAFLRSCCRQKEQAAAAAPAQGPAPGKQAVTA